MFSDIPFGMFGEKMGGETPPRRPEQKKEIDNKKFYERLEVDPKATEDEIRRAFKKKSIKEHPDKGGDTEKYKELTHVYEVLRDPKKRKIYDQFGEKGLESGAIESEFDLSDLLGGHRPKGPKKAKTILQIIEVSLADVYKGIKRKIKFKRFRICKECEGKGAKDGVVTVCPVCRGQGKVTRILQMDFMASQTIILPCEECQGKGKTIKDKCKVCHAKTVIEEVKEIELEINKGTPDGYRETLNGEADEFPGMEAGDIVFEIHVHQDKEFLREGADLYISKKISLFEAILGVKFNLIHLDGKTIEISSPPGKVIGDGETLCLEDQGMPLFGRSYKNGNLFVKFSVSFPTKLNKSERKRVSELFHESPEAMVDVHRMKEYQAQFYKGTERELFAYLNNTSMEEDFDEEEKVPLITTS